MLLAKAEDVFILTLGEKIFSRNITQKFLTSPDCHRMVSVQILKQYLVIESLQPAQYHNEERPQHHIKVFDLLASQEMPTEAGASSALPCPESKDDS